MTDAQTVEIIARALSAVSEIQALDLARAAEAACEQLSAVTSLPRDLRPRWIRAPGGACVVFNPTLLAREILADAFGRETRLAAYAGVSRIAFDIASRREASHA